MNGFAERVSAAVASAGVEASLVHSFGALTLDVSHRRWREAVGALRDEAGCTYLDWLSAVDETPDGLRVLAHLVALPERPPGLDALLVRTQLPARRHRVDSLVPVFAGAAWHEREAHEMFGLDFVGGVEPEPLLLAERFEGHPLRKDFVLASRVVTTWPGAKNPGATTTSPSRRRTRPPGVPEPGSRGTTQESARHRRTRRATDSTAVTPPCGGRDA